MFGIAIGTYLAVVLIEVFRERRERARRRETRDTQLVGELAESVATLLTREGSRAFPLYRMMWRARRDIVLSVDSVDSAVRIDDSQAVAILMALMERGAGSRLQRRAIREARRSLLYSPGHEDADATELPIHEALVRLARDLEALERTSVDRDRRLSELAAEIVRKRGRGTAIHVDGLNLTMAFGWFDDIENIFIEHSALLLTSKGAQEDTQHHRVALRPLSDLRWSIQSGRRLSIQKRLSGSPRRMSGRSGSSPRQPCCQASRMCGLVCSESDKRSNRRMSTPKRSMTQHCSRSSSRATAI